MSERENLIFQAMQYNTLLDMLRIKTNSEDEVKEAFIMYLNKLKSKSVRLTEAAILFYLKTGTKVAAVHDGWIRLENGIMLEQIPSEVVNGITPIEDASISKIYDDGMKIEFTTATDGIAVTLFATTILYLNEMAKNDKIKNK